MNFFHQLAKFGELRSMFRASNLGKNRQQNYSNKKETSQLQLRSSPWWRPALFQKWAIAGAQSLIKSITGAQNILGTRNICCECLITVQTNGHNMKKYKLNLWQLLEQGSKFQYCHQHHKSWGQSCQLHKSQSIWVRLHWWTCIKENHNSVNSLKLATDIHSVVNNEFH